MPGHDLIGRIDAGARRAAPSGRQCVAGGFKPPPGGFVGWQSEPVMRWRGGKTPDQNPGAGEMAEQIESISGLRWPMTMV